MEEQKTYELVIPSWHCAVPEDWKLETGNPERGCAFIPRGGDNVTLLEGCRLRGNGGPEEAYLAEMLAHGYVREAASSE